MITALALAWLGGFVAGAAVGGACAYWLLVWDAEPFVGPTSEQADRYVRGGKR